MSLPISFSDFFPARWGFDPFPWQSVIAARLSSGNTPDFVAVRTGSGKIVTLWPGLFQEDTHHLAGGAGALIS